MTDAQSVEAMAKAHCDFFGGEGWWDTGLIADTKPKALEAMRAALAAMPATPTDQVAASDREPVWRSMDVWDNRDEMVLLLVDYTDGDHPLDNALQAVTIGHNNDHNVGEGEGNGWQFAGWCWTHDHYVEGRGQPIGWRPISHDLPATTDQEKLVRHDERQKIIAQGCIHTRKAGEHADYDRPDVSAWQADQSEYFDPTICEIVSEYAAWRDGQDDKLVGELVEGLTKIDALLCRVSEKRPKREPAAFVDTLDGIEEIVTALIARAKNGGV